MEPIKVPLWKTKSEKGTEYYRGMKNGIVIGNATYKVSLFENLEKKSDKSPDMNIVLTEMEKEPAKNDIQVPQNAKSEYDSLDSDVKLSEDDLPF